MCYIATADDDSLGYLLKDHCILHYSFLQNIGLLCPVVAGYKTSLHIFLCLKKNFSKNGMYKKLNQYYMSFTCRSDRVLLYGLLDFGLAVIAFLPLSFAIL